MAVEVRRDHVIRDAMFQLEDKDVHDLKKQLRITFKGEDGIDEGGIQKEFFHMIVQEMFNSQVGDNL
jgi:ubiquitin-protein ligase E3 A